MWPSRMLLFFLRKVTLCNSGSTVEVNWNYGIEVNQFLSGSIVVVNIHLASTKHAWFYQFLSSFLVPELISMQIICEKHIQDGIFCIHFFSLNSKRWLHVKNNNNQIISFVYSCDFFSKMGRNKRRSILEHGRDEGNESHTQKRNNRKKKIEGFSNKNKRKIDKHQPSGDHDTKRREKNR